MPIFSLPSECLYNIFFILGDEYLYNCLFVNRYWCIVAIPILWRNPFNLRSHYLKPKLINTLLSCLNNVEVSSLIPFAINLPKNQNLLFDYGKFIKIIDQEYVLKNVISWLREIIPHNDIFEDRRIQCLTNAIYHMIIRQGLNLQEFDLCIDNKVDMLFLEDLAQDERITNLRILHLGLNVSKKKRNNINIHYAMTFLIVIPLICHNIIEFNLYIHKLNIHCVSLISYIIKSQPLERMTIHMKSLRKNAKEIIHALTFRSKTLKILTFTFMNLEKLDLSFVLKLELLEKLKFTNCKGFVSYQHCDVLSKKLQLKVFTLLHCGFRGGINSNCNITFDVVKTMIGSLSGESLNKLTLNVITPEIIKIVKESCPNINYLNISIKSENFHDSMILNICDISSLRILILHNSCSDIVNTVVKILGDNLTYVEQLFLGCFIDLPSFEYFTNNCKANLKKLSLETDYKIESYPKEHLLCISNYQKIHKSLEILEFKGVATINNDIVWSSEELEIVTSLENQGIQLNSTWYK